MKWTPPPIWSVPREWPGARCYVLCGGASVFAQRETIARLSPPIIAVKHGAFLRPDADVAFFAGERAEVVAPPLLAAFRGRHVVVRGKGHPVFPSTAKRVWRTTTHEQWSDDPTMVAGYDAGTSAINVAMLFGATTIVVIGMDMTGGHWFRDPAVPVPPASDFERHLGPLPSLAADAVRKGVRIINASPISAVTCFERQPLEAVC